MYIKNIVLYGYLRLLQNGITYASYTPKEKMQLIIGSNGSGKSSLLKELTPLPALRNEFTPDGYKIVTIEHNGKEYILRSRFGQAHPYNFMVGDNELNTAGTFQTQKELVLQHFNVTFEIYEFLLGQTSFTQYSPSERRRWLTMLSHVDYDYALKVYQNIKDQHRDIVGALKLAKARLVTHESQILSETDIQGLKDVISKDRETIESLLVFKTHGMYHDQLRYEQKGLTCELEALIDPLLASLKSFRGWDDTLSLESLQHSIWKRDDYALKNSAHQEKYTELDYTLTQLQKSNIEEDGDIDKRLLLLLDEKKKVIDKRRFSFTIEDPVAMSRAIDTSQEILTHIFHSLPENSNRKYSKDTYSILQEEHVSLSNQLKELLESSNKLSADIKVMEHYKEHSATECPECHHTWIIGYDEDIYQKLLFNLDSVENNIKLVSSNLSEITTKITSIKEYIELYKTYISIKQNWPILNIFFEELDKQNILLERPTYGTTLLQQFRDELEIIDTLSKIDIQIEEYHTLKSLAALNRNENIESLKNQREEHAINIKIYNEEITKLDREIDHYRKDQKLSTDIKTRLSNGLSLFDKINSLTDQEITLLKNQTINDLVQGLKLCISENENKLHTALTIAQSIEDIKLQIGELESKEKDYKVLQSVLSPTEGIISESITGFINTFTEQVNSIIKQIWSYPLEVLPCSLEKENHDELTYRFPVRVKNTDKPIPDIKRVSAGMIEVIDLSFKIVAMKYLGLSHFPLYLDEFGKGFDAHHRHIAMQVITNLLTQSDFTQIFLISHHESSYGSLRNTDINVMCSENVVVPDIHSNQLELIH